MRSPDLMGRGDTVLLLIDLQERLLAAQPNAERLVWNSERLATAARELGVRTESTVQAPEKLGNLPQGLARSLPDPHSKLSFSACGIAGLLDGWHEAGVRHVLLAGIETHVCVAQTAFDLIARGFQPLVCADAVGSRFSHDHEIALRRLEASGVLLTTTEAAMFEWCEAASDDAFRTISGLAKQPAQ